MAERITIKHLRALADRLNKLTGSPETYIGADAEGKLIANVGHYHISGAYGGWCLHRTMNEGGGVTCPIAQGHIPARELYEQMHAYIRGIETGRALALAELAEAEGH